MTQQQNQPSVFEMNEAIKKRAELIRKERNYEPSTLVKARAAILANLNHSQKQTLQSLAKSGNLVDLQTYLHAYTSLSVPAIDSFLALVKGNNTESAFNEFCSVWGIK